MTVEWIPVTEKLPEVDEDGCSDYLLLSYENWPLPDIGQFKSDLDGSGAFYPRDYARSCTSFGLIVNAWMPIIESYREKDME